MIIYRLKGKCLCTDPLFLHLLPDPVRKFDPAVIVSGATQGPDHGKEEPGLYQLHDPVQSSLRDWLISLDKK